MAPFAAGVNPVRNSSGALNRRNYCKIYPSAEQRGIISNGVKNKDLPQIFLKCDMASLVTPLPGQSFHRISEAPLPPQC